MNGDIPGAADRPVRPPCPHLKMGVAPLIGKTTPNQRYRCALGPMPAPYDAWQTRFCLTASYPRCPYVRGTEAGKLPLAPVEAVAGGGSTLRRAGVAVGVLALIGVGAAVAYSAYGNPGDSAPANAAAASPTTAPVAAVATPKPVVTPTAAIVATPPAPTLTPEPTPEPSPTAAAIATPAGTPSVVALGTPAPTTHTIAEGETLAEIAERYHTTVQTLAQMNDIVDPNRVPAGLVLRLPTPVPTPAP